MNNRRKWNMNQYCFNNQRMVQLNNQRNNFPRSPRYQDFNPNFKQSWNTPSMPYDPNRYQPDFRPKRDMNWQQFRMIKNNNNKRRYNDGLNRRSSWVHQGETCFKQPEHLNFIPIYKERKTFHRESSLPPVMRNRKHETRKPEFFDERSLPNNFSSFKRTIRDDYKSDKVHDVTWSDSESDSKDASWIDSEPENKDDDDALSVISDVQKDEQKLISMIWSDDSDKEEVDCDKRNELFSKQKGTHPFKHTSKSLPRFDGATVYGDEGVFGIKVFHCTFCNIICLDEEKSKAHMTTKYHYKSYKKELEKYEEDIKSSNTQEH